MLFDIVKICRNDVHAWRVDTEANLDDAVELARLYAEEHYKGILGDTDTLRDCRYGARFVTNNGTPISYVVQPHTEMFANSVILAIPMN